MDFNKEKLVAGTVFKNYKDMCTEMDIEVKAGNSKKAQLKELERYCYLDKDGYKIRIKEVYDVVKEKDNNYIGNTNRDVYGDIIKLLLLDYLTECRDNIVINRNNLYAKLGMTNRNYSTCKANYQSLADYIGINIRYVYDFYNINDGNFKGIVDRTLNNLQDQRLIIYEAIIKVKHKDEQSTRRIFSHERDYLIQVEKEVLDELGYSSISKIRISSDWRSFRKRVTDKLRSDIGIQYYYFAYDISINHKYIRSESINLKETILHSFNREENLSKMNQIVMNNIDNNTNRRNVDVESNFMNKAYRLNDSYINNTFKLSTILIDRNTKYLGNDILNTVPLGILNKIDSQLPF